MGLKVHNPLNLLLSQAYGLHQIQLYQVNQYKYFRCAHRSNAPHKMFRNFREFTVGIYRCGKELRLTRLQIEWFSVSPTNSQTNENTLANQLNKI